MLNASHIVDVLQGSSKHRILDNIAALSKNYDTVGTPVKDSKIDVVIELPNGGDSTKYMIGETDDALEVKIQKHAFMLNPQALLFAVIESGHISDVTDGPYTA